MKLTDRLEGTQSGSGLRTFFYPAFPLPRALLIIAVLFVAGVTMLDAPSAAAAEPQSVGVSNLDETGSNTPVYYRNNVHLSNSFNTGGSTTDRFTLNKVILNVYWGAAGATVRIYNDSNGSPGAQVGGDLVRQGSANRGLITFNAPSTGVTLHGGSAYWLMVVHRADTALRYTAADSESGTNGWSIGNVHYWAYPPGDRTATRSGYAMFFKVDAGTVTAGPNDPNEAPRFTSPAAFNAPENRTAVGTVVATDADSQDSVTYAIQGGADQARFSISSAGTLTFNAAPDYEDPQDADGNNEYVVVVRATGGAEIGRSLAADQTITVTVTNADEAPTGAPSISGRANVRQTLTADTGGIADQDGLTNPGWTYQWLRVDGTNATDISGATGSTYVLAAADQGKKVRVRVSFTDDGSNAHSLESADTGVIAAPNEAPRFTSPAAFSVVENRTSVGTVVATDADSQDSVTYAIQGGADQARFSISSAGTLTFDAAPDYEDPQDADGNNEYVVVVRATGGAGDRSLTADQTVTVTVTNADDAPTGAPNISGRANVRQTLTADTGGIADQDGLTNPGWTYQWLRVDGANATDISGATGSTYVLAAADQGKKVRVRVSFTDDGSNAHSLESADTGVIAAPNEAPRFTSPAAFSVVENRTSVGTVVATDADSQDSVTYAIQGGADQARFSISSAGTLTFDAAPDYEDPQDADGNNEYVVVVRATGGAGDRSLTTDQTVTVTVTDADDAPTGAPSISGRANVKQTLTASTTGIADQDGLTNPGWTYQWLRVDGANATGIAGATSSTYVLAAADLGKKLRVRVSFTDDGGNAHTLVSADSGVVAGALAGVSNLGETDTNEPIVYLDENGLLIPIRNSFSTGGSRADRFALEKVVLNVYTRADLLTVRIHEDSGGGLGAQVGGDLILQAGWSSNTLVRSNPASFNAPPAGITLHGGSAYWLVVVHGYRIDDLGRKWYDGALRYTASDSQSGTDGWSIGNGHYWSVGSGWLAKPEAIHFEVDATAAEPVAPAAVDADSISVLHNGTSLSVSWDAPKGATHYDVTYTGSDGVTGRAAWNRAGTSLTVACDSREGYENQNCVSPTAAHKVSVRARNLAGVSAWTDSGWFSVSTSPPVAPSSVNVTHNGSSLAVTWDAVDNATSYDVNYTDADAISWQKAKEKHTGTSLTISGVDRAKTYLVAVRATNYAGAGDWTNSARASLGGPDAVSTLSVTHNGSSLTVSWDAPARATHYDVTYTGSNGDTGRAAWNRAGTSLTITCDIREGYENRNCVSATTNYKVAVRARNAAGMSDWTNTPWAPAPSQLTAPDPVTSVNVVHNGSSLTVSWDAPVRATRYDVTYFNTVTGVNARAAWNRAGTSLTITCDSRPDHQGQNCVNSAGTYTVGVRAKNAAGESEWRNSVPADD